MEITEEQLAAEGRGHRALAAGWRWMDGVLAAWPNGHRLRVGDGEAFAIAFASSSPYPDTDDPATQGCIEHVLLFEAWPDARDIQVHWTREGVGDLYIHDRDGEALLWSIEGVPKPEALVSCLEAASGR